MKRECDICGEKVELLNKGGLYVNEKGRMKSRKFCHDCDEEHYLTLQVSSNPIFENRKAWRKWLERHSEHQKALDEKQKTVKGNRDYGYGATFVGELEDIDVEKRWKEIFTHASYEEASQEVDTGGD